MRDVLPFIERAIEDGRPVAWARVVSTWGSAPRRPGAAMVVASPKEWAGSVSGGCVEHAVVDEALGTLATGLPQIVSYGVSAETAWSTGLSCGGTVRIHIERFPMFAANPESQAVGRALVEALRADRPVVLASPMTGSFPPVLLDVEGTPLEPLALAVDPGLVDAARRSIACRTPVVATLGDDEWLLHPLPARDRLIIVGGSDIACHLIPLAHALEFETLLIDPRRVLVDGSLYIEAPSAVLTDASEHALSRIPLSESCYAVLLTHDPQVDDPALHVLLRSPARYIGALGGRKTQEARRSRLRSSGFSQADIERIDGPVGVPILATTPAEIAVSIAARLVERRRAHVDLTSLQ